jgi:hypothetical protein
MKVVMAMTYGLVTCYYSLGQIGNGALLPQVPVTKDVEPFSIYGGNPAKRSRTVSIRKKNSRIILILLQAEMIHCFACLFTENLQPFNHILVESQS